MQHTLQQGPPCGCSACAAQHGCMPMTTLPELSCLCSPCLTTPACMGPISHFCILLPWHEACIPMPMHWHFSDMRFSRQSTAVHHNQWCMDEKGLASRYAAQDSAKRKDEKDHLL